jgi:hypothetical protein
VELLAIPVVAVIFGIGALVLFAATEGPWAWILLGLGLLLLVALIIWRVTKRQRHPWSLKYEDAAADLDSGPCGSSESDGGDQFGPAGAQFAQAQRSRDDR